MFNFIRPLDKIPISRDKDNKIIYNYKLLPGISNQFIALELLEKKGFDKDIIRKAQKINRELVEDIEKVRPKRKLKKKKVIKKKKDETVSVSKPEEIKPRKGTEEVSK